MVDNYHFCPKHGKEECQIYGIWRSDPDSHHMCTNLNLEERYERIWKE